MFSKKGNNGTFRQSIKNDCHEKNIKTKLNACTY